MAISPTTANDIPRPVTNASLTIPRSLRRHCSSLPAPPLSKQLSNGEPARPHRPCSPSADLKSRLIIRGLVGDTINQGVLEHVGSRSEVRRDVHRAGETREERERVIRLLLIDGRLLRRVLENLPVGPD